jgi:hypothetical protein
VRIRLALALSVLGLLLAIAGCGSSSGSGDQTAQSAKPAVSNPESGTQANGGFPGAGSPTAPDVTTTPGAPAKQSGGKAGGSSSATCIGC